MGGIGPCSYTRLGNKLRTAPHDEKAFVGIGNSGLAEAGGANWRRGDPGTCLIRCVEVVI